jgi:hypothetical protein
VPEELKRKLAKPSVGQIIQSRVQLEHEVKHEEDDGFDVDDDDDEDDDDESDFEEDEDDETRLTPKATLIDDNRLSYYYKLFELIHSTFWTQIPLYNSSSLMDV